jgi:hypothetical protein
VSSSNIHDIKPWQSPLTGLVRENQTHARTGCLSQRDNAKEFNLKADDGSTWEVCSSDVSLADHLGHKLTATGVVSNATAHNLKEDTKDIAHDTGVKKNNNEHGHLKVTDVQIIREPCSQLFPARDWR